MADAAEGLSAFHDGPALFSPATRRRPARANIWDRDGAPDVIADTKESFPTLAHPFADGGYPGEKLETAPKIMKGPTIEIVKRPDGVKEFVVIAQ